MPRNYEKEREWQRATYRRYQAKLKIDEATKLDAELEKSNTGFTDWVRAKIGQDNTADA